jgi:hypothetical protein
VAAVRRVRCHRLARRARCLRRLDSLSDQLRRHDLPMSSTPAPFRYDAFLSCRCSEPDRSFAQELLVRLERAGFFSGDRMAGSHEGIGSLHGLVIAAAAAWLLWTIRYRLATGAWRAGERLAAISVRLWLLLVTGRNRDRPARRLSDALPRTAHLRWRLLRSCREEKASFPVRMMFALLEAFRGGYYSWRVRSPSTAPKLDRISLTTSRSSTIDNDVTRL